MVFDFIFTFILYLRMRNDTWTNRTLVANADANWRRATGKFNNQTKYAGKGAMLIVFYKRRVL